MEKIPWKRKWQPTPVFLPRKSHGQRSLAGYSPFGRKELDMTEWLILGASQVVLVVKNPPANAGDIRDVGSIPGSGRSPGGEHGNPLQCSCLENPRDGGAWLAAVYGVAQSRTRLKRLSSSKCFSVSQFPHLSHQTIKTEISSSQWRR